MQLTGKCTNSFRSEFKLKNFGFSHNHLDEFCRSQWQRGETSWWFLLYRWIWTLFYLSVFISSLLLQFSEGKFFIFLTNWTTLLCLATELVGVLLATRWHFDVDAVRSSACEVAQLKKTPKVIKLYWLLHDVTLPLALVITTIYWTFLRCNMNKPTRFSALSFVTHCLNTVFMLVDFLIVAFPVRLLHAIYASMMPIIFSCFTIIYYFCGGKDDYGNHYIYPVLDWTVPSRGILTLFGGFALCCIYPTLLYLLFRLKRLLHRLISAKTLKEQIVSRVGSALVYQRGSCEFDSQGLSPITDKTGSIALCHQAQFLDPN